LGSDIRPGHLVTIPFRQSVLSGVIVELPPAEETPGLRDVLEIADPEPVLLPHQLALASWICREYRAPLSDVLGCMLPPALKRTSARRSEPSMPGGLAITSAGKAILRNAQALRRSPARRSLLQGLDEAGGPALRSELQCNMRTLRALVDGGFVEWVEMAGTESEMPPSAPNLSRAQAEAVGRITRALKPPFAEAGAPAANGYGSTNHSRAPNGGAPSASEVFLLHGVTGSGKTEVYMAVIDTVVRRGRGAIVMVPEISLTPQAERRFTDRFPGLVATIHSALADGSRRREWQRLRAGQARIAVGPRSALFGPVHDIGAIIVDEEHDASYKQGESPRYHARDVAIQLGRIVGAPVVLGSATPDVCSYYHARKGRYVLLNLPERPVWMSSAGGDRAGGSTVRKPAGSSMKLNASRLPGAAASRAMPAVEIVDLRQELKTGNRGTFSRALLGALEKTVSSGHQALLFLNRRGSATSVVCRNCGHVATCAGCAIPLTFHSVSTKLICHRCDRRYRMAVRCHKCGSEQIRYLGVGTQRVVEEVAKAMPGARVLRWDRDVTGRKGAHESIAAAFDRHEADILVGTQMIAKGLDYPLVTLVGVIVADVGLNLPDFRAAERTFQLMTQVAGRAGRAELPSRVIIQAYNPEHFALQAARRHAYWDFYRQEMTFRLEAQYPPFSRLVRFLVRGNDDEAVARRAHALGDILLASAASRECESIRLAGPAPAFVARVDNVFQWHLLAMGPDVHQILNAVPEDVIVDVDPVDLL
jgi:primosomal protein N' (replication factor Y)